ncbi:hypothetical protein AVEN_193880-1 [Araneus ventricosus]|uniref:Uncharacterized protein n=1 Tax=Araneus ventricosus TaxID=182803 RepID=A0A4Y2PED6_ARAVE|nr:hypothetical protein AVEN_193880-1 [Araneus ventricosus]
MVCSTDLHAKVKKVVADSHEAQRWQELSKMGAGREPARWAARAASKLFNLNMVIQLSTIHHCMDFGLAIAQYSVYSLLCKIERFEIRCTRDSL